MILFFFVFFFFFQKNTFLYLLRKLSCLKTVLIFCIFFRILSSEKNESSIKSDEKQIFEPKLYPNIQAPSDVDGIFEETSLVSAVSCENFGHFCEIAKILDIFA